MDSPPTIRDDLGAACARAWQRIARCGTWWNGAQRIAIAAETRNALQCGLCRERKAALSPFSITGEHDGGGELPGPVVEVVHRVRTDSGRLTRAWYEGVLASGLSVAQYVEIVGVVATTSALDTFSRGIGVAPTPLPPPQPGEPTRHRPARAKQGVAWVPTLELSDVADADPDPYPGKSAAEVFNIHRALSLVPDEAAGFFDLDDVLYLPQAAIRDFSREYRSISHAQIELLAARVSAINQCHY